MSSVEGGGSKVSALLGVRIWLEPKACNLPEQHLSHWPICSLSIFPPRYNFITCISPAYITTYLSSQCTVYCTDNKLCVNATFGSYMAGQLIFRQSNRSLLKCLWRPWVKTNKPQTVDFHPCLVFPYSLLTQLGARAPCPTWQDILKLSWRGASVDSEELGKTQHCRRKERNVF